MQSSACSCPAASSSTHHCSWIETCRGDGEGQSLGEGLDVLLQRGSMGRGENRSGFLLPLMLVMVLLLGGEMPPFPLSPLAAMDKVI